MSHDSDKVIADINKYIDAMRDMGKMPTTIHITKKQYLDLKNGLGKAMEENWKPRIRSIPVEVIDE